MYTFGVFIGNDLSTVLNSSTTSTIVGFTTQTPTTGDIARQYNGLPYTGSYSYIKIFNWGGGSQVNEVNKVYAVNGNTGVLGALQS